MDCTTFTSVICLALSLSSLLAIRLLRLVRIFVTLLLAGLTLLTLIDEIYTNSKNWFRLPPSSTCCLTNAEMSSRIAQLFPELSTSGQESSQVTLPSIRIRFFRTPIRMCFFFKYVLRQFLTTPNIINIIFKR